MMKTFTIVTDNLINNFDSLGPSFTLELKSGPISIKTHNDPRYELTEDGGVVTNFDLMISSGYHNAYREIKWADIIIDNRLIVLPRKSKLKQALILNNAAKELKINNYRSIKTASNNVAGTKDINLFSFGNAFSGKVVIKPLDGARGIGHILMDTNMYQPYHVLDFILKSKVVDVEILQETFPGVVFTTARELSQGEGVQSLRDYGVVMQEFVPNIKEEYRIIFTPDDQCYAIPRPISDSSYPQPEQPSHNPHTLQEMKQTFNELPKALILDLKKILRKIDLEFGSLDLFITDDGQWGIFEYCNQFGINGINLQDARQLHRNVLAHWLNIIHS